MAESVDLNNLTIKTDSLPDNWKMLLIDPVTLQPAQNITVSRFIELLIGKMPEVTKYSNGLMSSSVFNSMIYNNNTHVGSNETIDNASPGVSNISVDMAGSNTYGLQYGVLVSFTSIYYRAQIAFDYRLICKMRIRTETGWRSWLTLSTTQDLKSTQPNALTESFSNSYSFTPPPPPQIACQTIHYQQVLSSNLRIRLYWIPTSRMVQLQLSLNQTRLRRNTSGQLTRSAVPYWNYKKKTKDLKKSSISLMRTRYNKCNLPRAGPPRLIN